MNVNDVNACLDLLTDRFENLCRTASDREKWREKIVRLDPSFAVVYSALSKLVADWKPNRNPTDPEIRKYVERAQVEESNRSKIRDCYGEARVLRDSIGDPFLAMFARPAREVCVPCADDYVQRGVSINEPLLRHAHYTNAELDADPAIEIAIAGARAAFPVSPLDAMASPRTPEAQASMCARGRAAFEAISNAMRPKIEATS